MTGICDSKDMNPRLKTYIYERNHAFILFISEEKEKMNYDPLVDSGNKGKQFNIEFLVIPIHGFFGFPTNYLRYSLVIFEKESINDVKAKIQWHFPEEFKNIPFNIRVSDPKVKTYKDMKLQDKVSDYFDKNL
ncbi:7600_t:CDS:2 [Paraglomus brasilianum]|uniref:7600_t:CDS:1 n=1 Tax=Paraglomus brasilianum TaxID=144538 RepID=A0A9N9H5N3_9GLOM|nr:7600_t:CDS:2 [Paraglomus brasilianum]